MAKTIRVMVAEDFPLLREDFCDVVSAQSDMEVVGSAASGEEIVALAGTTPCDVILMDIEMETIDAGIRAAEVITARHPEVKILFLTAHETDDMITSAMGTGAVDYVVSQGLLSGSSRSHFSPEQPLNRAMLAQVLFQLAGQPDGGLTHFTDVPDYSAVSWAVSRDIMSGVDGETFAPERPPTRQELALTLFRYAKEAGLDTKKRAELTPYSDADQVAGWAREAVEWAVAQGLLAGRSAGGVQTLAPLGTVTRAEFSAVLKTLCETVLPKQ